MYLRHFPHLAASIAITGDPKIDLLLRENERRPEIRKQYGYREGEIVVLVMSTWGPLSLFASLGEAFLAEMRELSKRYRFIFSIHPNNFFWKDYPDIIRRAWNTLNLQEEGLLIIPPSTRWEPYMVCADVAVSDHTSMALYYTQLHRPLIAVKVRDYKFPVNHTLNRLWELLPLLSAPEELAIHIQACLKKPVSREFLQLTAKICGVRGNSLAIRKSLYSDLLQLT